MKSLLRFRPIVFVLGFQFFLSTVFSADLSSTVTPGKQSTVGDRTHWTATNWSSDDSALFEGIPVYRGPHKDLIILRYSYYVSDYDADRLCPLWVAHVDVGDTAGKAKTRVESKDPKWKRIPFG